MEMDEKATKLTAMLSELIETQLILAGEEEFHAGADRSNLKDPYVYGYIYGFVDLTVYEFEFV